MTRVLLVTGSRSLATHPGVEAWARGLIHAALVGTDLLIVGDAPGPDAWTAEIASSHDVPHVWRFGTHGASAGMTEQSVHVPGAPTMCDVTRWAPIGASTHPLDRNRVMVATARAHMLRGCDVRVLALLDGTKRDAPSRRATRGTEHTAGLAERAGIVVTRRTWPENEGDRT